MGQFENIFWKMQAQGVRGKCGAGAAKLGSAPGGKHPSYATDGGQILGGGDVSPRDLQPWLLKGSRHIYRVLKK